MTERAEYLVLRRFPFARAMDFPTSLSSGRSRLLGPTPEMRRSLADYRAELAALPADELVERYNAERQREHEQLVAKAEQEERERFFNLPDAVADYDHWSRAAHWTLDEAIALSFGRAPELVRWDQLQKLILLGSPFVIQYARRRDLALRAKDWKQLFDPVLPGIFLAWAKRTDIDVPAELVEAVQKRGVQIADWKSLYEEAAAGQKRAIEIYERATEMHDGQIADWKRLHEEALDLLRKEHSEWLGIANEKDMEIAELKARIESLEQLQFKQPSPPEQEVGARSRDSLLKLVIGMAVVAYVYDPKAVRSDKTTEIADDLASAGVPLDVDTVRKWLREAAELLPRNK